MKRSKDPLTAATTTFLKPAVSGHGFVPFSKRCFVRLTNRILQFLDLQLSAYGSQDFAVNYFICPVFPPREFVGSTLAGRFPRGASGDGWWSAEDHGRADASMQDVVNKFDTFGLPLFERTSDMPGLANELSRISTDGNPHTFFALGCALLSCQEAHRALEVLQTARRLYQECYEEFPQRDWCLTSISQVDELLAAIAEGNHDALLDQWERETWVHLKLSKKLKGQPGNKD
jgi:hypothetical protein